MVLPTFLARSVGAALGNGVQKSHVAPKPLSITAAEELSAEWFNRAYNSNTPTSFLPMDSSDRSPVSDLHTIYSSLPLPDCGIGVNRCRTPGVEPYEES